MKKTTQAPSDEEDRRRDQVRDEGLALVLVEAGRDEFVDLDGDHREGDEQRAEQRHLHLRDEKFLRRGVDQLRYRRACAAAQT